jgi:chromosome segregation ATPase
LSRPAEYVPPPAHTPFADDPVTKWKREAAEQEQREQRYARERTEGEQHLVALERRVAALERDRCEDRADVERLWATVAELVEGTKSITDALDNAIDEMRSAASQPAKAANEHMEALFARLEKKLDEIVPRRRDGHDEVIDMPPLPSLRRVN